MSFSFFLERKTVEPGEKVWETFARSCLVFIELARKNTDKVYRIRRIREYLVKSALSARLYLVTRDHKIILCDSTKNKTNLKFLSAIL